MSEITKSYEPRDVEKKWYASWLAAGAFAGRVDAGRARSREGRRFGQMRKTTDMVTCLGSGAHRAGTGRVKRHTVSREAARDKMDLGRLNVSPKPPPVVSMGHLTGYREGRLCTGLLYEAARQVRSGYCG